ncbi:hypothetical protein O6H91_04G047100 [Diphasiastrum complanatum]|uniref:Uncharacterized protein n=1 Tax=Diphasiastrum complanatum TaxID=34168 RepID=A0ACC2DWN4_DIPCM|nr:hypothetical protein O6H91_04G047100 [Diphasiastrum complanatum]
MRTGCRASCWKHPAQRVVGVCAPCLRERLVALASSEERFYHRSSKSSRGSTSSSSFISNAHVADASIDVGSVGTVVNLVESDWPQPKSGSSKNKRSEVASSKSAAMPLRRSVSWSQSKSSLASLAPEVTWQNDGVTRPFSAVYIENSAPSGDGVSKIEVKKQPKSSSWLSSLLHWRFRKGKASSSTTANHPKASKNRKKQGQLSKSKASSTINQPESGIFEKSDGNAWEGGDDFHRDSGNSWMSGPLPQTDDFSYGEKDSFGSYLRNSGSKIYDSQPMRRVIPLSPTRGSEQGAPGRSDFFKHPAKNSAVNSKLDHRESSWKPWATPMRIFNRKSRKAKEDEDAPAVKPWKLSSDYDPRPSPAHPATYSTFYRDHGSLSLYSSPIPGGKSRGRRPWDGRSEMFHSSPYMGNSSWNFYLTPVRPIKSSLKQRP